MKVYDVFDFFLRENFDESYRPIHFFKKTTVNL